MKKHIIFYSLLLFLLWSCKEEEVVVEQAQEPAPNWVTVEFGAGSEIQANGRTEAVDLKKLWIMWGQELYDRYDPFNQPPITEFWYENLYIKDYKTLETTNESFELTFDANKPLYLWILNHTPVKDRSGHYGLKVAWYDRPIYEQNFRYIHGQSSKTIKLQLACHEVSISQDQTFKFEDNYGFIDFSHGMHYSTVAEPPGWFESSSELSTISLPIKNGRFETITRYIIPDRDQPGIITLRLKDKDGKLIREVVELGNPWLTEGDMNLIISGDFSDKDGRGKGKGKGKDKDKDDDDDDEDDDD